MNVKNKERIVVGIAALIFFVAFGTIAYMDSPHGSNGDDIGQDEVDVVISRNTGHFTGPNLPDDLLILVAGQRTVLDFSVTNNDENNDIDTIFVTVPGSDMINGTTLWFQPGIEHEWDFNMPDDDVARFQARDDYPGREFGGSSMYDVAGNVDDALDHGGTPLISESITVSVEFNATETAGTKSGNEAIDLEVADMQTESPGTQRHSIDPFPYSYLVIEEGYEFITYSMSGDGNLEIVIDGETIFSSSSRASGFQGNQYGFKYISDNGDQVVVLDAPAEGTVVKPIVRATEDGGGEFTLDYYRMNVETVDPDTPRDQWVAVEDQVEDFSDSLPGTAGEINDPDYDGDGDFNFEDDDDDNDGIPDEVDVNPFDQEVANSWPILNDVTTSATEIEEGEPLILSAQATDPDPADVPTVTWTIVELDRTEIGETVEIDDLEPGTYTVNITVDDGRGGVVYGDEFIVTITEKEEEEEKTPIWLIILIIAVVVIVIIGILFFIMRGREEEEPEEMPPQPLAEGYEEAGPDEYESYEEPEGPAAPDIEETMYEEVQEYEETPEYDETSMAEEEEERPVMGTMPPSEEEEEEGPLGLPGESDLQEVQDLEQLIDEMERTEEEIGDICPECNAPLGPYDTECPNCGAQFEIALECPNCGAVVEDNVDSCPSCGVQFQ